MKASFQLVIIIPVGPGCKPAFIEDTIVSVKHYVRSTYKIILADDSQNGTGQLVKKNFPEVDVLQTPAPMGKLCGLYITLSLAFSHALDKYQFQALLRMDTDALIIGNAPERKALELFESAPMVGMAGQYPLDYNGQLWDNSWPGGQLWRIMHTPYFFTNPLAHIILIRQYLRAKKNSYQRGESVFGGACFFSYECLKQLRAKGFLPNYSLKNLKLEEDHLFSVLVTALGFKLGSLSGPNMPIGCAWRGLPASPRAMKENGKKIIHSTRYWEEMNEEQVRAWFRERRTSSDKEFLYVTLNNQLP